MQADQPISADRECALSLGLIVDDSLWFRESDRLVVLESLPTLHPHLPTLTSSYFSNHCTLVLDTEYRQASMLFPSFVFGLE